MLDQNLHKYPTLMLTSSTNTLLIYDNVSAYAAFTVSSV